MADMPPPGLSVIRRWECKTCGGLDYHREGCADDNYPHDPRVEQDQGEWVEYVPASQLAGAVEALRIADNLLRQFSISANDHSELIRREFGKAQRQINDVLYGG